MANKTINQFPAVVSLGLDDVVLGYDVGRSTTVKVRVSNIINLAGGATVDASSVAAAGAIMTSFVSGSTGYLKRVGTNQYNAVTVIQPSEVSGLKAVATTGTLASLTDVSVPSPATGTFLKYSGTQWVPASAAAGAVTLTDLTGWGTIGLALASAGTATSAGTLLNLGTLATTSTAASARTYLNLGTLATTSTAASGISFLGLGSLATTSTAASAKTFSGLATTTTDKAVTRYSGTGGNTQDSVVLIEDAGSMYGYMGKVNNIAGSSYTVVSSDTGKTLVFTASVTCSATLPNSMQPGFNFSWIQHGAGVIQFVAATSSTLENRQSYVKSAGQHAIGAVLVSENSNGTAAHWTLGGDMA